ncbi:ABC transporter substrate-binding protein [Patulibacter defluvii]|uniref:ABC transporter substrate-binding protein n=1 Tax=Patulibacter defluvii TaxID=3095358 RepID=UPI002A7559AB|nr:ABC transporter substrate-binding protein [Patulibacter sp. DM4]
MRITSSRLRRQVRRATAAAAVVASAVVLSACGGSDGDGGGSSDNPLGLQNKGTLTVGMNLQFEPEMYLKDGEPAGYDVDLLNELAKDLGVKLKIENLDFNGLIPGLQSKKFDIVSVGLAATEERKKAIDFSRGYVPYAQVVAVREGSTIPATIDAFNQGGRKFAVLQGSTGEQLAKKTFPKASVTGFSEQNAALLQVATKRADASVLEDYLLAQYQKSNPGQLVKADFPKPLDVQYGSYGVVKGNSALVQRLDQFLCKAQTDGTLERLYKKNFGVKEMPQMPSGC